MKKLLMVLVVVLLTLGFGLVNFAGAAPKGTLTVAQSDFSTETVDPNNLVARWSWALNDLLITHDPNGNIIGEVAESFTISPDGNTWTFKIRKGMKFHNGDPVTSADVAFSCERFSSEKSTNPWSPYLRRNFAGMETPDDYTFVYKTNKPEPQLTEPFAYLRILPKNYIEKNGMEYYQKHPVGSGPWKFVKHVEETSFEMEAYTEHWRQVPGFARVKEIQVPEESTRVAMLKRGEVDMIGDLSFDRVVELRDEGFQLQEMSLPTLGNITFAGTFMTDNPTKDIRVRRAMSYAINRQEICDTFFKGLARPGSRWFMTEQTWGWDPNWKADPYDPEKAKALLKEAGYPGKFRNKKITLFCPPRGYTPDLMQILAGYWLEIGLPVDVKVIDDTELNGMIFVRAKDASGPVVGNMWPWVFAAAYNNVYHSANMFTSKGVHTTANDPKADALYAKAANELDLVKAKQYWTEFINYAYDVLFVNMGIMSVPNYWVLGPRIDKATTKTHLSVWEAYAGILPK